MSELKGAASDWALSAIASDKGFLRVQFCKQQDRFTHALSVVRKGESILLLDSQPGDDTCPAFQELHKQEDSPSGGILFLTGMAAGRYWSMSVTATNAKGMEFDIACRGNSAEDRLRIDYALPPNVQATVPTPGTAVLACGDTRWKVCSQPAGEQPACEVELDGHRLSLLAGTGGARWAFSVGPAV